MLNIETISVPNAIKESVRELSKDITFHKVSPKGANGYIFFGKHNILNQQMAVKYYYWGGDKKHHAEPRQLAEINSKYVVKIHYAGTIDDDYAFFTTPFYPEGDLDDLLSKGMPGNIGALQLTTNILDGLSSLHSQRLIHRDLKPQNILVSQHGEAVIGDFGSVKKLDADAGVPGSGHSLLYTPPESFDGGLYSKAGDIYQVGIVLYQLLGGYLPYNELPWLNTKETVEYNKIADLTDRTIFVDKILKKRIQRGRILNLNSLPPWVCTALRKIITKACHPQPSNRFLQTSDFMSKLHSIKSLIFDWQIIDGVPTLLGKQSYRIINYMREQYYVEKKKLSGWRKANTFGIQSLEEQVSLIEKDSQGKLP